MAICTYKSHLYYEYFGNLSNISLIHGVLIIHCHVVY